MHYYLCKSNFSTIMIMSASSLKLDQEQIIENSPFTESCKEKNIEQANCITVFKS